MPSPWLGFPVLTSLLRVLLRGPALLRLPLAPLTIVVPGGCFDPDGARVELIEGEGEDWEDLAPFMDVWTAGGGGRFIFW